MFTQKNGRIAASLFVVFAVVLQTRPLHASEEYCAGYFNGKTIRWIVPHSSGGGYDTYSRLVAPFLEKYTGADVLVQNIPGAGGQIGAAEIMNASPDGFTIGILNGPGLAMAALFDTEGASFPDPAKDFTILGRVARNRHVWTVAKESSLPDLATLLVSGQERPMVFGTQGPGTVSFVSMVVIGRILDLDIQIVTGFRGSRDAVLGLLRGDVDIVSYSYSSIGDVIESEGLRVLLQVTDGRINDKKVFDDVPWLAGPDGLAVKAAGISGKDPEQARADGDALVALMGVGRLVAAPLGLEPELSRCMSDAVYATLNDTALVEAAAEAGRALDVARGEEAGARLGQVSDRMAAFVPILKQAGDKYAK